MHSYILTPIMTVLQFLMRVAYEAVNLFGTARPISRAPILPSWDFMEFDTIISTKAYINNQLRTIYLISKRDVYGTLGAMEIFAIVIENGSPALTGLFAINGKDTTSALNSGAVSWKSPDWYRHGLNSRRLKATMPPIDMVDSEDTCRRILDAPDPFYRAKGLSYDQAMEFCNDNFAEMLLH